MRRAWLAAPLALASCGFEWTDTLQSARDAIRPQALDAVYSPTEDLTAISWATAGPPDPGVGVLEIEFGGVRTEVEDSGLTLAGAEHGGALVYEGRTTDFRLHLRMVRGADEVFSAPTRQAELDFTAQFTGNNRRVRITIADPLATLAGVRVVRDFTATLRLADCLTELDRISIQGTGGALDAPADLNATGDYCVRVSNDRVEMTKPVRTRVHLERVEHRYVVPVATSRLLVVPVFDLVFPQDGRCAGIQTDLLASLTTVATELDPAARVTEPIEIATGASGIEKCARSPYPTVFLSEIQQRVGDFPDPSDPTNVLVVAFHNLGHGTPYPLAYSYGTIAGWLHGYGWDLNVALVARDAVEEGYDYDGRADWTYSSDPALSGRVAAMLTGLHPYRRFLHDSSTLVELFGAGQAVGAFGYKVCESNAEITPWRSFWDRYIPVGDDGFGGYWVSVPPGFLPDAVFEPLEIEVSAELCWDYCTRGAQNWSTRVECGP